MLGSTEVIVGGGTPTPRKRVAHSMLDLLGTFISVGYTIVSGVYSDRRQDKGCGNSNFPGYVAKLDKNGTD